MRQLTRVLVGILGLAAVAVGALWVALPGLVAPVGAPPVVPPPDNATLVADLHTAGGGAESLQLTAAQVEALSEGLARFGGLSAAWVTLGQGSADLHLAVVAPASLPRLGGHTIGVEVVVEPKVASDGTLTLSVEHIRAGRIPVDALVPVPTIMQWVATHAGPPQPWWHVEGAAVVVDPKTAPPLNLGQFALRVTPSALSVSPTGLVLTGTAQALVRLDAAFLSSTLAGTLQAQALPVAPTVRLQPGRVILSLLAPTGAEAVFALTPSVTQPGVLRVAVAGPGDAAGAVAQVLGDAPPPWLSTDPGGLTVDFRQMPPIEVAQGVKLRLLPESVQVDPTLLQGWVSVLPAQAG